MSGPLGNGAGLPAAEQGVGEQLAARRPAPAAGFRGGLRRYLSAQDPGYGPRPPRLRLAIAARLGAGALLIAVGTLQATGTI